MLSYDDALTQMLQRVDPIKASETVLLQESLGRILSDDIVAPFSLPRFPQSAMDGYAIQFNDLKKYDTLECIGNVFAGDIYTDKLESGQCVRIMTGACVPCGADTVVMQEHVKQTANKIYLQKKPHQQGEFVREIGSDVSQGQCVVPQKALITPAVVGLLAALGNTKVQVFRPVRVAIFSSGNEVVPIGRSLNDGQIYDANRELLISLLKTLPIEILDLGIMPDDKHIIRETLDKVKQDADLILGSGGVSVGQADYVRTVLEELGEVDFWRVAIKPGKPVLFGQIEQALFLGLPGNPVSAFVAFYLFALPLLKKLANIQLPSSIKHRAKTTLPIGNASGRRLFLRGWYEQDSFGEPRVTPLLGQDSHMLLRLTTANCLIMVPEALTDVAKGTELEVQLLQDT